MNPRRTLIFALVLTLIAAAPRGGLSAANVDEYQLKAAVLYNLAKFVDYPPETFSDPSAPFVMCILGVDPFGQLLDEIVKGRLVGKRPIVARRLSDVAAGCHLLFVASSERRRLPAILDRLRRATVLTVGDAEGFAEQGGMVGLVTEADRVRFEINTEAVDRVNLKLSARLMVLASPIRRTGDGGR